LWDGAVVTSGDAAPSSSIRLRDRGTLWKIVWDPWYQFGEAYAAGRLEVDGDLAQTLVDIYAPANAGGWSGTGDWRTRLLHPRKGNSLHRSRKNVYHHYDIGNDFYQLWLDAHMLYTCAYFAEPDYSLEQAQIAKMEHVCRKLQLTPGQHVVEAGCGWGGFALYMARHFGVTVKAFNISVRQVEFARERARREGLDNRVQFVLDDWRGIREPCDVFVSIGMLEHVGKANYRRLGEVIHRCLSATGRGLIHSIGQNLPRRINAWIERRVFPGGYPPALSEALQVLEPFDFSVLDVENLRLHYAETLRHWLARYERSVEQIRSMFDDQFVRIWRLYLCGSLAAFASGSLQLFQILFARGTLNDLSPTRQHLYADPPCPIDVLEGDGAKRRRPR
jgi:cyclopropane-fatty-acyl-phospholipid synthase